MAGSQELAIFVAALVLGAVLLHLVTRPRSAPQIPPTVSPLSHPLDEDVRTLKHEVSNMQQVMIAQTHRIDRQEKTLDAVHEGVKRTERQLDILIESGLKRDRP